MAYNFSPVQILQFKQKKKAELSTRQAMTTTLALFTKQETQSPL